MKLTQVTRVRTGGWRVICHRRPPIEIHRCHSRINRLTFVRNRGKEKSGNCGSFTRQFSVFFDLIWFDLIWFNYFFFAFVWVRFFFSGFVHAFQHQIRCCIENISIFVSNSKEFRAYFCSVSDCFYFITHTTTAKKK